MTVERALLCGLLLIAQHGDTTASADPRDRDPAWSVSAGTAHTCAIKPRRVTICWGENGHGEAGGAISSGITPPHRVAAPPLVRIAAGGRHTCGLDEHGRAWCWGDNSLGQLGSRSKRRAESPVQVSGDFRFATLAAGHDHTCALTAEGRAYCWGDQWDRAAGALDAGDDLREPFPVLTDERFVAIAAGGHHTCAITKDARAFCWGNNARGQVDPTSRWRSVPRPTEVAGLPAVGSMSLGETRSCALSVAGTLLCWGEGLRGPENEPPTPLGKATFTLMAVGGASICAGDAVGNVACWRSASDADDVVGGVTLRRTAVEGLEFSAIDAGDDHTCGVSVEGPVYCWGGNEGGQLGSDVAPTGSLPVVVPLSAWR